jgi:hypothetical protein
LKVAVTLKSEPNPPESDLPNSIGKYIGMKHKNAAQANVERLRADE